MNTQTFSKVNDVLWTYHSSQLKWKCAFTSNFGRSPKVNRETPPDHHYQDHLIRIIPKPVTWANRVINFDIPEQAKIPCHQGVTYSLNALSKHLTLNIEIRKIKKLAKNRDQTIVTNLSWRILYLKGVLIAGDFASR